MACTSNRSLEYLLTQFRLADAPQSWRSDESAGELVVEFTVPGSRADMSTDCFLLCTSGQHLVLGYAGTDYIIINTGPASANVSPGGDDLHARMVGDCTLGDLGDGQFDVDTTGFGFVADDQGAGLYSVDAGGQDNRAMQSAVTAVVASQVILAEEPRQGETADTDLGGATGAGSSEFQVNIAGEVTATPSDVDT